MIHGEYFSGARHNQSHGQKKPASFLTRKVKRRRRRGRKQNGSVNLFNLGDEVRVTAGFWRPSAAAAKFSDFGSFRRKPRDLGMFIYWARRMEKSPDFAGPLLDGVVQFVFLVRPEEIKIEEALDLLSRNWRPLPDDKVKILRESTGTDQDRLTIILPKAEGKQRFLHLTPRPR